MVDLGGSGVYLPLSARKSPPWRTRTSREVCRTTDFFLGIPVFRHWRLSTRVRGKPSETADTARPEIASCKGDCSRKRKFAAAAPRSSEYAAPSISVFAYMRQPKKPAPDRRADAGSHELPGLRRYWTPRFCGSRLAVRRRRPFRGTPEPIQQAARRQETADGDGGSLQPVRPAPWPTQAPAAVKLSTILAAEHAVRMAGRDRSRAAARVDAAPDITRPPAAPIPDLKSIGLEPNGQVHAVIDRRLARTDRVRPRTVLRSAAAARPGARNLCAFVQQMSRPDASRIARHWTSTLARWKRPDRRARSSRCTSARAIPPPGRRRIGAALAVARRRETRRPQAPPDASPLRPQDTHGAE